MNASTYIELVKKEHREKSHWFCFFTGRHDWLHLIKGIPSIKYSQNKNKWYLPYSDDSLRSLKQLNIPYTTTDNKNGTADKSKSQGEIAIIAQKSESVIYNQNDNKSNADISAKAEIEISWSGKGFVIKISYNEEIINNLKKLQKAYWHSTMKCWIAASTLFNLKKIQEQFNYFDEEKYQKLHKLIGLQNKPLKLRLYLIPMHPDQVVISIFGYGKNLEIIKSIPDRQYDKESRKWLVPNNSHIINQIIERYKELGYKIDNRLIKAKNNYEPKKRIRNDIKQYLTKCELPHRDTIIQLAEVLVRENYSITTFRSYASALILIMKAHNVTSPSDLEVADINRYLATHASRGVSESKLNMIYSALKLWYNKIAFTPEVVVNYLRRPRKALHLPNILSIGEVRRILQATSNLKHTSILYTLYGSGLRLNELLSVRITDIHWERDQILVRQGKGKKDRMVMMSAPLKAILSQYFHTYTPEYWLYEGTTKGKPYSASSVNKLVKNAALKANVNKRVTPHTLRHCFATHLMDSGIDTRFIQSLLGHKDIKTTMIYTHVTNSNLNKIKSPLDSINDKKWNK